MPAYDQVVTVSEAGLFALLTIVLLAGVVTAFLISERLRSRVPAVEPPPVSSEVAAVLAVLRSSAVIVDDTDQVLKASAPAYALGIVQGTQIRNDRLVDVIRQVRRDGQIRQVEMELRPGSSKGAVRHVSARIAPLGAKQVLALVDDRTKERRVEAIRRDFVGNVSHELKTPIGAIRLLAEATLDASDDPDAVERFAARMITESERLTTLVQQILELSRLQADDPVEENERIPLDDVIATAVDTVAIDSQARRMDVVTSGTEGLEIIGAREQVTIAIGNLVANAVNYSPDGSTVRVEVTSHDDMVDISVTDQGIGIPPRELDRIFERFYRVDPARHRSTGGTGLGLSIVKHVAATHGGEIRVQSVEGEGSTFSLTLPRARTIKDKETA